MTSISNFLLTRGKLSQALDFYASVFGDSLTVTSRKPYGKVASKPATSTSTLMSAAFKVHNQEFKMFDFGPDSEPTEAVSFFITCSGGQAEIDRLWAGLSGTAAGGEKGVESQCGWVRDPFGYFWQIIPKELETLLEEGDGAGSAQRVMRALWGMGKIDIEALETAAKGDGKA